MRDPAGEVRLSRRRYPGYVNSCERKMSGRIFQTLISIYKKLAEREGFEPSIRCRIHTFQACSFDRSDTSPGGNSIWVATQPATPRHPNPLLPLLPSRPDGVHNFSSRGDRRGSPLIRRSIGCRMAVYRSRFNDPIVGRDRDTFSPSL